MIQPAVVNAVEYSVDASVVMCWYKHWAPCAPCSKNKHPRRKEQGKRVDNDCMLDCIVVYKCDSFVCIFCFIGW